jgi:hypothetical protein
MKYWCEQCQVESSSYKMFQDHLHGKKHKAKVQSAMDDVAETVGGENMVWAKDMRHIVEFPMKERDPGKSGFFQEKEGVTILDVNVMMDHLKPRLRGLFLSYLKHSFEGSPEVAGLFEKVSEVCPTHGAILYTSIIATHHVANVAIINHHRHITAHLHHSLPPSSSPPPQPPQPPQHRLQYLHVIATTASPKYPPRLGTSTIVTHRRNITSNTSTIIATTVSPKHSPRIATAAFNTSTAALNGTFVTPIASTREGSF